LPFSSGSQLYKSYAETKNCFLLREQRTDKYSAGLKFVLTEETDGKNMGSLIWTKPT